jgi:hypothetical protein
MATPIKRIEKEFFFNALYNKDISLVYLWDQKKYHLTLENSVKASEMVLKLDSPIPELKPRTKMELMFDFQGQVISCVIEIKTIKDRTITAGIPEFLYKNLDRSHYRIAVSEDLQMSFSFQDERYNLPFPKLTSFEDDSVEDPERKEPLAPNIPVFLERLGAWVKKIGANYKLVIFKDVRPTTTEELAVAETGKALYLASTREPFPETDPFPEGRIITDDLFKQYLENAGMDSKYLDETTRQFVQTKLSKGISSDIWAPILFQEYVVGYIHVWIAGKGAFSLDIAALNTLFRYTKNLVRSLKANGFFEKGLRPKEFFTGKIIDISVSGILFAYPKSTLSSALLVNSKILIRLVTGSRTLTLNSRIVRRFRDSSLNYYGCHFVDTSYEDVNYLLEYLYGKSLSEDTIFQIGKM